MLIPHESVDTSLSSSSKYRKNPACIPLSARCCVQTSRNSDLHGSLGRKRIWHSGSQAADVEAATPSGYEEHCEAHELALSLVLVPEQLTLRLLYPWTECYDSVGQAKCYDREVWRHRGTPCRVSLLGLVSLHAGAISNCPSCRNVVRR